MIKLLELRVEKGKSQREMAAQMSVSQGTYNNWENGRTQPSIEQLIALAEYFAVSVDYLIGRTDDYGSVGKVELYTESERELVRCVRGLDETARNGLLEFLKRIK